MNQAIENILTRRSCRKFKSEMLPDELLRQIADAATWAPTGKGKQAPLIVVVKDKATRDLLSAMNAQIMGVNGDPFYGAPVVAVILADTNIPTYKLDGCAVLTTMLLAAHALGVGSCWINRAKEEFESAQGKELLRKWGIGENYAGVGHCVLGYAATEDPKPAARKADYVKFV